MKLFVKSDDFKALNIGFALDEGMASASDVFPVFYAERTSWSKVKLKSTSQDYIYVVIIEIQLISHGTAGHGSLLLKDTAIEKLLYCIHKLSEFRASESKRLDDSNGNLTTGDVTTVNLTVFEGGVQANVVPPVVSAVYDIRLALDLALDDFEQMVIEDETLVIICDYALLSL